MSKINYLKNLKRQFLMLENQEDNLRNLAKTLIELAAKDRENALGFYEAASNTVKAADAIKVQYNRINQDYLTACDTPYQDFEDNEAAA